MNYQTTIRKENSIIKKVSFIDVSGNLFLSAFKLIAGIYGHSGALISDAVHSLSDVLAALVAFLGVKLSKKSADRQHPYGHERLECVASLLLSLILFATGFGIGETGLLNIFSGSYKTLAIPGRIALIAAIISILLKEAMYWFTRHYAKILNSPAFMADAWHHRSDALASVGSLIGIGGAMLGFPVLDCAASVIISLLIIKVAYTILKDSLTKMLDTSCGEDYEKALTDHILSHPDVIYIDLLQSRMFGNKIYVDLEIQVNGDKSLREAHKVAEDVHRTVEQHFAEVKHIMIHVNPYNG